MIHDKIQKLGKDLFRELLNLAQSVNHRKHLGTIRRYNVLEKRYIIDGGIARHD